MLIEDDIAEDAIGRRRSGGHAGQPGDIAAILPPRVDPIGAGRRMRPAQDVAPSRYGRGRSNWPALILVLFLHVAVLALLLLYRAAVPARHAPALKLFDVAELVPPPPAPPPPAEPLPPVPTRIRPRIVAPPPLVAVPPPPAAPPVETVPTPSPPVAVVEAPQPAPAPVTRTIAIDDFSMSMISADPPHYPIESRRKREQGTVALMLLVGTDGRVASVSVQQSSGFARLDAAALSAVRRWRWSPRKVDGVAVQVRGIVSIPFVLRG